MADRQAEEQRLIELMVAYQSGSMDAFTELYRRLEGPLGRYLWTFVRNRTTADDLLQDAFLQLHRARHTYTPPRPVRPWVYAITRHVALMHLRSSRRRKESVAAEELPEVAVPAELESFADRATVHRLLATLPRPAQEVLILHHLLGLSFDEIGRIIGIAGGTAKVRAHRAMKALREQLDRKGGSPT